MPVFLDIDGSESEEDIVTIGPGTMRRKSPGKDDDILISACRLRFPITNNQT